MNEQALFKTSRKVALDNPSVCLFDGQTVFVRPAVAFVANSHGRKG